MAKTDATVVKVQWACKRELRALFKARQGHHPSENPFFHID
jgi:hypothetical protein